MNPDAIDCSVSVINPEASLQQVNIEELNNQGDISSPPQSDDATSSISFEKAALFPQRYEGYDLPDDEYMKWLREAHPESMTTETAAANENDNSGQSKDKGQITTEKLILFNQRFEEGYDLPDEEYTKWLHANHPESISECFVSSNSVSERSPLSISDAFSYLPVASPVTFVTSESLMETNSDVETLSEVVKPDDKFINTSTTAKVPQLKDIESASTNNSDHQSSTAENDKAPEDKISLEKPFKDNGDDVSASKSPVKSNKTKAVTIQNTAVTRK